MDLKAFFKLSYGVYIVTSKDGDKESGCVINTMTQVTSKPAQLCVTLNKDNYTTELVQASGIFNVSVLLESVSMDTIRNFGFQSGKNVNKFENFECLTDTNGLKYPAHEIAATFSCRVNQSVDVGSHIMFIAEVQDAKHINDEQVLTYAAYHDKKNGVTPKNSPSYIEEPTKKGWRCDVCGYIYEGDDLPEDFTCPVCKAEASHFHKI